MKYLVLSCSLKPDSKSRVLARTALGHLQDAGVDAELLDLADWHLPHCDGDRCYDDPAVKRLRSIVTPARGIIVAAPVYNFDLSSSAKNVIELTGSDGWEGKVVGFACAAGGQRSYMSMMGLANSLMLDFRSVIVPRFAYARRGDVEGGRIVSERVAERLELLASELLRFTEALSG
jgi:FMN reductase